MTDVSVTALEDAVRRVLEREGSAVGHARLVARHLVEADRMGVASHGVQRLVQYVGELRSGKIDGTAVPVVARDRPTILMDGRRSFGQVAATRLVALLVDRAARAGMAAGGVRRCGHAGRMGAYAAELASNGYLGLVFCSGPPAWHRVAPYGGREGRLATNPIAYGIPTTGAPIVADFATSAATEGQMRLLTTLGLPAPPGVLQDADGLPTSDPGVLYRDPPGTLLPFGGATGGHKGYALGILVEALATLLGGDDAADRERAGNNVFALAIAVPPAYPAQASAMADYLRSSSAAEPGRDVLVPGEPEARRLDDTASSVAVADETLDAIAGLLGRHGLEIDWTRVG